MNAIGQNVKNVQTTIMRTLESTLFSITSSGHVYVRVEYFSELCLEHHLVSKIDKIGPFKKLSFTFNTPLDKSDVIMPANLKLSH